MSGDTGNQPSSTILVPSEYAGLLADILTGFSDHLRGDDIAVAEASTLEELQLIQLNMRVTAAIRQYLHDVSIPLATVLSQETEIEHTSEPIDSIPLDTLVKFGEKKQEVQRANEAIFNCIVPMVDTLLQVLDEAEILLFGEVSDEARQAKEGPFNGVEDFIWPAFLTLVRSFRLDAAMSGGLADAAAVTQETVLSHLISLNPEGYEEITALMKEMNPLEAAEKYHDKEMEKALVERSKPPKGPLATIVSLAPRLGR